MELTGKIIKCLDRRSGESDRGKWSMQDFVMEYGGNWKRHMMFSVRGEDRLNRFNIKEGQDVLVLFDVDAREYQGKWYNSLNAYDVRLAETVAKPEEQTVNPADPFDAQNLKDTI